MIAKRQEKALEKVKWGYAQGGSIGIYISITGERERMWVFLSKFNPLKPLLHLWLKKSRSLDAIQTHREIINRPNISVLYGLNNYMKGTLSCKKNSPDIHADSRTPRVGLNNYERKGQRL